MSEKISNDIPSLEPEHTKFSFPFPGKSLIAQKHQNSVLLILAIIFLLCALVWPFKLLGTVSYESASLERGTTPNLLLSDGSVVQGTFSPLHSNLTSLSFQFQTTGTVSNGRIHLSISDNAGTLLKESSLTNNEALNGRKAVFPLHLSLSTDQKYTYTLSAEGFNDTTDTKLHLYTGGFLTASADTLSVTYNGYELKDQTPLIIYTYHDHADFRHALLWYLCFWVFGILLLAGTWTLEKKRSATLGIGLFFYLSILAMLLLTDESAQPIRISGSSLKISAGASDDSGNLSISPDSEYTGVFATSSDYLLNPGSYRLAMAYTDTAQGDLLGIYDNGKQLALFPIDPALNYAEFPFELRSSSLQLSWQVLYNGGGTLSLNSFYLIPEGKFYNDTAFLILIVTVIFLLAFLIFIRNSGDINFIFNNIRSRYYGFGILMIGLMAFHPYLQTGLNWAIDLCYHLVRIEGIKDGLLSGQFPVVIFPEAQSGNGYLNVMYPNLLLYFPALLRMAGVSMADSFKFLVFVIHIATAAFTWYSVKSIGGSDKAGFLAAALYTLSPYRFTNLYARGAIGEFLAMTFLPLIFAGLYHVFLGNSRKWPLLVLGMTGLLQTHVLSVLLAFSFCILCGILYFKNLILEKRIRFLLYSVGVTLLLNLGFLIPFLDFFTNGNLWMSALSFGSFSEYSLNLSGLLGIQITGDYHILTFGLPIAFCAVLSVFYLWVEKRNPKETYTDTVETRYLGYLSGLGIALTLMMLCYFPANEFMKLPLLGSAIGKIQFAWRLLGPATLLFAMAGSISLFRSKKLKTYANILLILLLFFTLFDVTRFKDEDFSYGDQAYTVGHVSKIIGIPKGDNTIIYPYEWRPIGTIDNGLNTNATVSDPEHAEILSYTRQGTTSTLTVKANSEGTFSEIPVLYYMGYQAVDENGTKIPITCGTNNRIRFSLPGDFTQHTYTVFYRSPVVYTIAAWISILSTIACIIKFILNFFNIHNKGESTKNA